MNNRVAIIDSVRTPFVKAAGVFSHLSSFDLASHCIKGMRERLQFDASLLDEVIFSTVLMDPRVPNFGRELVLRNGLPKTVTGHFVSNNCISGLLAASYALDSIQTGRIKSAIVGGVESMSMPALLFNNQARNFFLELGRAKTTLEKLRIFLSFRLSFLSPEVPSPKEPSTGLTMGQHCEITAKEFGISREEQDGIAYRSHMNASKAKDAGILKEEILPMGAIHDDNIVRKETSLNKLSTLKPVFDRSEKGTITAGNASPLTDGASAVLLMSESEAKRLKLEILGFIEHIEFASIDPSHGLLMAPAVALPRLFERTKLKFSEVDRFEVHEAFGAQVAANKKAWREGWSLYPDAKAIGEIPEEKLNVNGSSIALGHPFGATGGRIIGSLVRELKRNNLKKGVISICAAGAGAGAALITRE